jgi:hypothetical protein
MPRGPSTDSAPRAAHSETVGADDIMSVRQGMQDWARSRAAFARLLLLPVRMECDSVWRARRGSLLLSSSVVRSGVAVAERTDPPLARSEPVGVGLEHGFDGVGETVDGCAGTCALGRQENHPGVTLASRETLGCKRTGILDVVRDHGPTLRRGDVEDDPVAATDQVVPLAYGDDVASALAQQCGDLG